MSKASFICLMLISLLMPTIANPKVVQVMMTKNYFSYHSNHTRHLEVVKGQTIALSKQSFIM